MAKPPLRPFQAAALKKLRSPIHLVCTAPTGSGKSRIYEEFLLKRAPRTVIFSPLVALQRQQKESLEALGLSSGPKSKVWCWSPETLLMPRALTRLRQFAPEFLVMDECHSCWDWGASFRPALRKVPGLVKELKIARSLWLTATLPEPARKYLSEQLPAPLEFMGEFELPEGIDLRGLRIPWSERMDALLRWLERKPEPGIVFALTREGTDRLARFVNSSGRKAVAYHAGLSSEERRGIEARLRAGENLVIVATSAFGMGMHFSQLSWVVLWQAPPSLLALAQAIGRVGRGSQKSEALILWDEEDFRLMEWTGSRQIVEVRDYIRKARVWRDDLKTSFERVSAI